MSLFGKLKNIFSSHPNNDNKKKPQHSLIKFDADPNEFWEIIGELGDGAFGKVYKTRHKVQQMFAALKQVDINDETELEEYSVEIDILNQCRHKNIVGFHEAFFFGGKLWMFIEFCGGGALDGIMVELEKPLTEPQIRYVCREMCEALEFLHQHFVIHRDLKAGNVLLTCEGEVKLADFGVSAKNSSYRQKRDTFIGTPYWMAPEVILCETIKDSPYDFKSDIWSFGITLIELAQIEPPNHEMHPMRVLIKIQKSDSPTLNYPSKWSKEFNDFVTKCLARDPEQRPTTGELLQHPFIRDVKDGQAVMELVSEANAEIILEEKDLDEDLLDEGIDLENRSAATTDVDSDTASTTSNSNILKSNEDDSISDASPISGDAGKVPLPTIAVIASGDKKNVEPEKSSPTDKASPDADEPVILRKKKTAPDADKTSSPEGESTSPPTGQKKYRTLTKTRKFVVNGEVVMSTVSKVIAPGSATDKKQQEHQLWKADLRELKMLHKQEKKQLHDMDIRFLTANEEQNRKFEQDNSIFVRNAENSLEQLTKQHKQQTDKMSISHASEMKNMQKKTKQEQEKDLRAFNESLKQELKLLKQEVDLMPKEGRKEVFHQRKKDKEAEHARKEHKFIEQQKESMDRTLRRVEEQQKDQKALCERQFLQLKQQTIRARETSLWDAEITQLKDRDRLNLQQLDTKFILKKQLMMVRHAKEVEQVHRINTSKEEELLQCHLLENKRLPKIMKNEGKTRALMYKQSLRISVAGITAEQEKERVKQFEEGEKNRWKAEETRLRKKHRRQMEELKAKNDMIVKELEQVHAEKRQMLEDNAIQKRNELEQDFEVKMKTVIEDQRPKKEALDTTFAKEVEDNEKCNSNGTSVDQVSQMVLSKNNRVPTGTDDKKLSRISSQSTKKIDTSAPLSGNTKRSSKISPLSTKKIEVPASSAEDAKRLLKLSPQGTKKIKEFTLPSEVASSSSGKSTICLTKAADTNSKVLSDATSHRIPEKIPPAATNVDVVPPIKTDSVLGAKKLVLSDIPASKPLEEKIAIGVPLLKVENETLLTKEETIVVVSGSTETPVQLETKLSAVAQTNLASDSLAQGKLWASLAGVGVDCDKSIEVALLSEGGPQLVESIQKSEDSQMLTFKASSASDADVEDKLQKPVNVLPNEISSLPLNEEITEVNSTKFSDVDSPKTDAVGLASESKSELSDELLPEQNSITVVPDLCSDGSELHKTEFEIENPDCVDVQTDLLPSSQTKGSDPYEALENQSLASSTPCIDSKPQLELTCHQEEKSENFEHLQAVVKLLDTGSDGDLKTDQIGKNEALHDLTDSCHERSNRSPTVDHSHEASGGEFKNDSDPSDKSHFAHDVDKVMLIPAKTLNGSFSDSSKEQQDQFHQTSHMTELEDAELGNALRCLNEPDILEKNVQFSGEVSDSIKDKTEKTDDVTINNEISDSVQEERHSLFGINTDSNLMESFDCKEQQDQFHQTSHAMGLEDAELSDASHCLNEPDILEKNVQSSSEVSDSIKDKTEKTDEIAVPINNERVDSVQEDSRSLPKVTNLMQENTEPSLGCDEHQDQFHQTFHVMGLEDAELSDALRCLNEPDILEKNVQSSSEVSDSIKDKTEKTDEIAVPINNERVDSVQEDSSSLPKVTNLMQENTEPSLGCDEHHHEKHIAEPNLLSSDSCIKSDVKDVDDSSSEAQNEFADDSVKNQSIKSSIPHQQQDNLAMKEDELETCCEHEEIASDNKYDSLEKRNKLLSKERELHNESPVAKDENNESLIKECAYAETEESESFKTGTGEV